MERKYEGKLLNQSDTNLLLSNMQNTNNETLIPPVIPSGAVIYHKYRAIDDNDDGNNYLHDTSIIKLANGRAFALSVYTSWPDTGSDNSAQISIIQGIAKEIIDFFARLPDTNGNKRIKLRML